MENVLKNVQLVISNKQVIRHVRNVSLIAKSVKMIINACFVTIHSIYSNKMENPMSVVIIRLIHITKVVQMVFSVSLIYQVVMNRIKVVLILLLFINHVYLIAYNA